MREQIRRDASVTLKSFADSSSVCIFRRMESSIRVVCFDLGGVLVKLASGWEAACKLGGVKTLPNLGAWERQHALMVELERGRMAEEVYFERMGQCDLGISADELKCVFDAWLQGAYPGAAELIAEIKERGVITACLSNTNPRHWRQVIEEVPEYMEIMRRLDYRFASQEIGFAKPDERIYLHAQEQMKVTAEEILFFDDRLENVEGARAVGWHAEQITARRRMRWGRSGGM
jgi:HAD superfamily hydrolase (TIGR01509 family)